MKKVARWVGVGCAVAAGSASAAIDPAPIVAQFTDVGTFVVAVGVAMLAAAGAGIVYRWATAFLIK